MDSGAPAAAAVHLIVDGVEQVRGSRVVDPAVRQAATVWTSAAAREVQIEDTGLVAVVARTRNLQVGGCGEAARLAAGGCSRRTSRMRSFCWSRVIVVTEDIAERVAGVSSGRSAENPCGEEVLLALCSAALS